MFLYLVYSFAVKMHEDHFADLSAVLRNGHVGAFVIVDDGLNLFRGGEADKAGGDL